MGLCVVSTFFCLLAIFSLRAHGGKRIIRDHQDALQLARCDAKCWTLQKGTKAEVWTTLKSNVRSKVAKMRRDRLQTGNTSTVTFLTPLEEKVLGLLGTVSVEGLDVPEILPSDDRSLLVLMGVEVDGVMEASGEPRAVEVEEVDELMEEAAPDPRCALLGEYFNPVAIPPRQPSPPATPPPQNVRMPPRASTQRRPRFRADQTTKNTEVFQKLMEQQNCAMLCVSRCLSNQQKAGWCARTGELSAWDAACVRACERDSGCPGVLKCCQHDCGATCQLPRGLHEVQGLPGIPQNVTVGERRRGRAIRVRWSFNSALESTPLLFILEERHHVGRRFTESRLGEWTPRQRSQRSDISLKNVVKPGRWYQFRVAAINENGTRGFSRPSAPFTTSHGPRPPSSPQELTVDALRYSNGSLGGTLRWKAPISSDLPVHKYKVYWSRRLQGVDHDLDSVLVHHHTVGKDQTMFNIEDLQPRSLYFLQVQALAQFGTKRLKSEKSAIFLNTTNYSNDSVIPMEGNSSKRSADLRIEGLHLQKLYWSKDQMLASIAWRPTHTRPGKEIRYSVQWWTGQCYGIDKIYENRKHIAATTDVPRFKLNDLNFGCKYLVRVSRIGEHNNSYAAEITFKVPIMPATSSQIQK